MSDDGRQRAELAIRIDHLIERAERLREELELGDDEFFTRKVRQLREAVEGGDPVAAANIALELSEHITELRMVPYLQKNLMRDIRIRATPTVTDEDILSIVNDPRHPTRRAQAKRLGIGERQLYGRLKKIREKEND